MALLIPNKRKPRPYKFPQPDFDPTGHYTLDDPFSPTPQSGSAPAAGGPPASKAPNIAEILGGDPFYQQLLADMRAQSVSDRASLKAQRQRALVNFGEIPDFRSLIGGGAVGDIESDITPEIRSLAEQGTSSGISTIARLEEARKDAARQLSGFLAGRGLVRSGETGYQQGRQQTDYTRARYDSTQELLDYLAGYQSAYTQAEQERQSAQQAASMTALQNYLASNPSASAGQPQASPTPVQGSPTVIPPTPGTEGGLPHITKVQGIPPGSTMNPYGTVFDKNGRIIGKAVQGPNGWVFQPGA